MSDRVNNSNVKNLSGSAAPHSGIAVTQSVQDGHDVKSALCVMSSTLVFLISSHTIIVS